MPVDMSFDKNYFFAAATLPDNSYELGSASPVNGPLNCLPYGWAPHIGSGIIKMWVRIGNDVSYALLFAQWTITIPFLSHIASVATNGDLLN
ncbi:hypothetical protein VE03_10375 [Pseudogymnoascus sp. 23342-1-I1]|nr:hypothetical protein VE03_10375 [Pseudogymnoascus sp. 23342-1-I1]